VTTDTPISSGEPSSFIHHNSVVTPEFIIAMQNWCNEGLNPFVNLLTELEKSNVIKDPMIKTLIFNVFGGYLFNVSTAFGMNDDIELSHTIAFNELMRDPSVSSMVNSVMRDAVNSQISKVIE
tara:strand:- start:7043 stop:7411 length:369 start_codon:yes stop_codon:yes gene_type:complete